MAAPLSPLHRGFTSTDPELAAVDASLCVPVLASLLLAVHWMVTGTFLLVYASSLRHPEDAVPGLDLFIRLSEHLSVFTYGRVWPAAVDALVYGWAGSAALGLIMWLLGRMGRTPARAPAVLMTAVIFWNLGVAAGLIGIFLGQSTGVELLEFPGYAAWILWSAFALVGIWSVLDYLDRRSNHDHIGQAWILTGLFAFPWLYAAGSILLGSRRPLPGSGVIQGALGAWCVHGLYTLWLAPVGLGALYYLIPKVSGVALRYGSRARAAFWVWVVVAPWTAVHDMVGGPFPEETVSFGLVMSGLIFIPVALIGLSLVSTALDGEEKHHESLVLPFLTLAAACFVAAGISEQLLSIRSVNQLLRFTLFRDANLFLWVYGFFSFMIFGAVYYIVPRLLNFGWRSAFLIKFHFYSSVYGILLLISMLGFGGIMQGFTMENPDPQVTIATATQVSLSFYIATTMCLSVVSIGNGVFAYHLGWMVLDYLRGGPDSKGTPKKTAVPTLKETVLDPASVEEAKA
jgi:cytochrome c oxidase cbb3-type subunit 1